MSDQTKKLTRKEIEQRAEFKAMKEELAEAGYSRRERRRNGAFTCRRTSPRGQDPPITGKTRYEKSVAQYQGMIAAGHVRYVIGGREIGAELAMLLDHAKQDVRRGSEKLAKLQDMTDLKVAA